MTQSYSPSYWDYLVQNFIVRYGNINIFSPDMSQTPNIPIHSNTN